MAFTPSDGTNADLASDSHVMLASPSQMAQVAGDCNDRATPNPVVKSEDGLIYGFPDDVSPEDGNGAREILKVVSLLEAAGIICCMVDTSALIHFGARRIRGDWQICVPTDQLDAATCLLSSSPHNDTYAIVQPLPMGMPGSLRDTYPRFKRNNFLLWFFVIPSEECHIDCLASNLERSLLGLPFPKLEIYAQSLLDTNNALYLCDLIDGMNLSEEWGNQYLNLEGTNDVEWARRKNAQIRNSLRDGKNLYLSEVDEEAVEKRVLWVSRVRKKEHRLGLKHSKEQYATRFRTHKSLDPRLTSRT